MMEWSLNAFFAGLEEFGWYDVALPFILVWVIVFAVLEKAQIFGAGKRNISMIISLIAAFLFVRNAYLISIMNRFLPKFSILLLVLVLFLALVGLFGAKSNWKGLPMMLVFIIAGLAIWWALSPSPSMFAPLWARITPETRGPFIVTIVIVVIGALLLSSSSPGFRKSVDNLMGDMGVGD